jgi:D-alanine transaminase
MKTLGYYNGVIGEIEDMRIPMDDRACWFGDGVYDATTALEKKALFLEEHMDRFFSSASLLEMAPPVSKNGLEKLIAELVCKLDSERQFVYWQLTRGTAPRSHVFPRPSGGDDTNTARPNLWIFLRPSEKPRLEEKITLITVEDTRFFHCNIKTLNLIPNVMASEKAERAGAAEAVFYRKNLPLSIPDRVTECAHSNVHIIKDGVFRTAPPDNLILPGIARAHLLKQCAALGIPVREEPFSVAELLDADEVIVSSSGTFCLSAKEVDGRPVGGGAPELLVQLQNAVLDEVSAYINNPL